MERMLCYSLERDRVIRMIYLRDGKVQQCYARVLKYDADMVEYITTRSPRPQRVERSEILALDFRKGDDGLE